MRFDLVDPERVTDRVESLRGHLDDDRAYHYEARIDAPTWEDGVDAAADHPRTALDRSVCLLDVLTEGDDGELESYMLFPVLPLVFQIRPHDPATAHAAVDAATDRFGDTRCRYSLSGRTRARTPTAALVAFERTDVELRAEAADAPDTATERFV